MEKLKRRIVILVLIMLVGLVLSGVVLAKSLFREKKFDHPEYVPDEIIVKFKGDSKPFRVIKLPKGKSIWEAEREFELDADVEYAEPNYIAYALMVPNDEYYSHQWHFDNPEYGGINMEEAWDISIGDSSVVVAVIDTGIAYEDYCTGSRWWKTCYEQAPDLADTCFVSGYDFVNDDTHPNDDSSPGHGTHVAGTVAQSTNNSIGVAGVAFDSCLMPVKVLDSSGSGYYSDVADGIYWAVDNGAQVINLSLGGSEPSTTLEDAVAYAYNNGVTVIAAAGNDGSPSLSYPAAYDDYVIAVGATRYDENLAYYSNYGPSLDLVAPGGDLNVDQNNDGYGDGVLQQTYEKSGWRTISWGYYFMTGTSMAAPHVSGLAALLIANGNATIPDDVRAALQETAEDLGDSGWDETYGHGLIDAYAALGWTLTPECTVDADCDDGLYCNGTETCQGGVCQSGTPVDCSYLSDQCNDGACDEATDSCMAQPKAEGTLCEDGFFCTIEDYCSSGTCVSGSERTCDDSNECTMDTCNETTDACEHTNVADNTECTGGICCGGICAAPVCLVDADCSDTNTCTIDTCNSPGTCDAYCGYEEITVCSGTTSDGCCPVGCTYETDVDCPEGQAMHVANIEMGVIERWRGWYKAGTATVTIEDGNNTPVEGATVYGQWSDATSDSDSGITDDLGQVTFQSDYVWARNSLTFTLCVENVEKTDWIYDKSANIEACNSITTNSSRSWR